MIFEHAFGKRYELPIPLALFVVAGAAAVVLSFVLIARRAAPVAEQPPAVDEFPKTSGGRLQGSVGLLVLAGLIFAGLYGSQEQAENILPTFFWLVVWIVLPLSCGLLGDWTRWVNPFAALARVADRPGLRKALLGSSEVVSWPRWLGWWPAVVAYFALACGELVYNQTATLPRATAYGLLGWAVVSLAMGFLFGAPAWLRQGEVFSVLFNTWGRLGLTRLGAVGRRGFLGGLGTGFDRQISRVMFVLLMLVSVSYDGLISTPQWTGVQHHFDSWASGSAIGVDLLKMLVFVGVALATLAVFAAFAVAALRAGGVAGAWPGALSALLPSLLPIAFGYLLAHNLQYLLINGQLMIPLLGNPVGHPGWQWLPAPFNDSYEVNTGIFPSGPYWYVSAAIIVVVHVLAIVVAHRDIAAAANHGRAHRAEYPWLVAMVAYTVVSLWLLAQPLVEEQGNSDHATSALSSLVR